MLTPMTSPREFTSGPPEFPGIQRRVGLDDVVHQASRARAQRAAERADDAGRDRGLESVADCRWRPRAGRRGWRANRRASPRADPTRARARRPDRCRDLRQSDRPAAAGRPAAPHEWLLAPWTTWLLVRIRPSGVKTKPGTVPALLALGASATAFDGDHRRADELHGMDDRLGIGVEKRRVTSIQSVHTRRTRTSRASSRTSRGASRCLSRGPCDCDGLRLDDYGLAALASGSFPSRSSAAPSGTR